MNVGTSHEYRGEEGATTEWDDILVQHGIKKPIKKWKAPELPDQVLDDKVLDLDNKNIEEIDEMEDDYLSDDDNRALEEYRQRRLEELKSQQKSEKFGGLYLIEKHDFVREVTEASKSCYIILFLHQEYVSDSRLLEKNLMELSNKFKCVKFIKMIATSCIENFPDSSVPTIIIYHNGKLMSKIEGISIYGGNKMNIDCLEWVLSKKGVLESDLEEDPRENLRTTIKHI